MTTEPTPRWTVTDYPSPDLAAATEEMLYLSAESFHAIEINSGETAWSTDIAPGARINATEANVFVRQPKDESLRCLTTFDGVEMWETTLSGRFRYLLANDSQAIAPTEPESENGLLEAVDIESGAQAWSVPYSAPVSGITPLSEGIVLIDDDRRISLVDEVNGIERWSHTVAGDIHTHLAHEGFLCVGYEGGLTRINLNTGIEQQHVETGSRVRIIAPLDGGMMIGGADGVVSKVTWRGGLEWSKMMHDPITALLVADGSLYVGDRAGDIAALASDDGDVQWTLETTGRIYSLRCHSHTLCGRSADGSVFGLDPSTGDHRWRLTVDDTGLSPRIEVRGEDMYLHTGSNLVAIDPRDGSVDWKLETEQLLFGQKYVHCVVDGQVRAIPLLPDATTEFVDDRDEGDGITRIWRGN